MKQHEPNRRDFHQLTLAALGGALAGSVIGCGGEETPKPEANGEADPKGASVIPSVTPGGEEPATGETDGPDLKLLLADKHICRGLNTCKGKGADGQNECAGQGVCATAEHHSCGGDHDCKGLSGCGETAGINACKGQGNCGIPVMDKAWEIARANFEKVMTAEGREFGPAPEKME